MIVLVDDNERLKLELAGSRLIYRRLSLGELAALERQQAVIVAGPGRTPPRLTIPQSALEAAICAHVLKDWEGVVDSRGREIAFRPALAARLPAGVRSRVVRAACSLALGTKP